MECSVRHQLLIAMNDSLDTLDQAVERMAVLAGAHKSDKFLAAHGMVVKLRPLAVTAREDYKTHLREHGC
jgi:hypothetical protein